MLQPAKNRFTGLFDAAFAHPQGLAGRLGGMIMARTTTQRNDWIISLLDIHQEDHVLEVGCGSGALIQRLSPHIPDGRIVGIDSSPLMLHQASQRNNIAIKKGCVSVQEASAQALPFEAQVFDIVLSANSIHIWSDPLVGVKEMQRVLKAGGTIALVLQPVWVKTDQEVRVLGDTLGNLLGQAGFQQIHLELKPMRPIASVCVRGLKPV